MATRTLRTAAQRAAGYAKHRLSSEASRSQPKRSGGWRRGLVVIGVFQGVGEVGRERPVLFGKVMLAGPRDRERVASREGEAVRADLRVAHIEPDLAGEAA